MTSSITVEDLAPIAAELAFPTDPSVVEPALEPTRALLDRIDPDGSIRGMATNPSTSRRPVGDRDPSPTTDPPVGGQYNALLDRYPSPRVERDDGPLSGITLAVKDNIAVAGLSTTCGFRGIDDDQSEDAVVITRLLDAGIRVAGKANMDAFAIGPGGQVSEFGPVEHPFLEGHVTGGSSSGSAAAVAGGLVDAALGTDTGGSVRKPAAYCGLVGLKPTHGRPPMEGIVDLAPSLDTVGPIAKDVETVARLFDAMIGGRAAGAAVREDRSGRPYVLGVPSGFVDPATEPVRDSFRTAIERLGDRSAVSIEPLDLGTDVDEWAYPIVLGGEFAWLVRQLGVHHGSRSPDGWNASMYRSVVRRGFNAHIAGRLLPGAAVDRLTDGRAYLSARKAVEAFDRTLGRTFESVDALLMPTSPVTPPRTDAPQASTQVGQSANTRPFNLVGTPAVTVPIDPADGLPVGLQIVTPRGRDGRALSIAALVESDA